MDIKRKNNFYFSITAGLNQIYRRPFMGTAFVMLIFLISCSRDPVDLSKTELIRVGESQVSVREFKQIQNMSQDYYLQESDSDANSEESKDLRMLDQVSEELLIKEHAKTQGIEVSEADIDAAVENIKSDYPEDTFDQVLLENAVSFDFWRKRLGVRLLIDKVIEKELENHVIISPEDVSSYYEEHYAGTSDQQNTDEILGQKNDINEVIVKRLRKLKAEKAYKDWIKELQQTYPIQINWEAWKRMMESKSE
jgi:FKBP-type peptidyl-prolyl cis-trans isomerase (trigger factor)